MNRILTELDQKIHGRFRTYLPEISLSELEEGGTVYYQRDPAIFRHIDSPVGTSFVRVSPEAFEPDEEGKKIYMEQREH